MRIFDNIDSVFRNKIIKVNITKICDTFKKKQKEEYKWIYECSLDPRYDGDVCIAHKGHSSEPYCKHGLKLIRTIKKEE